MSTTAIALVAENTVILAIVAAGWNLLRQGGGLQVKAPSAPRKAPQSDPKGDAQAAPGEPEAASPGLPKVVGM